MKFSPVRFAFGALASLAMMASSASAVTILQFGQTSPSTDTVTATVAGGVTSLNTTSTLTDGSIAIQITNIGGQQLGTPLLGFETFTNVRSVGTATNSAGNIVQLYSGTIALTTGIGGTGGNYLTATFTNATLSGLAGGGSASLVGSNPPQGVTFTSNFAAIVPLIAGNPPENFSLSFSNIPTPPQGPGLNITGTGATATIAPFTAQNTGTFATGTAAVPEPASIAMVSMGVLTGLGCFMRRRQSIGA